MPPLWTIMSNIGALNVVDATKRRLPSAPAIYFRDESIIYSIHGDRRVRICAIYFRRATHHVDS